MSEQQKVFASVSGAFVVHLLLLLLVGLLLSSHTVGSSLAESAAGEPDGRQEVTIRMSDLMEQLEVESPASREEKAGRPFVSTDLNEPEQEAPEDARYESDRNTSAASELKPDPSQPQREGPTLDGDSPLPHLQLHDREYVDGPLDQPPAMAARTRAANASSPASSSVAEASGNPSLFAASAPPPPGRQEADAKPSESEDESGDEKNEDGASEDPVEPIGDRRQRPDGATPGASDEEETSRRSFVDPRGDPEVPSLARMEDAPDQRAAPSEAETGTPTDTPKERHAAAAGARNEKETEKQKQKDGEPGDGRPTSQPPSPDADSGLFAEGFSPEEFRNQVNGTLSNVGRNAVDAEATAVGRYKQAVKQAIAKRWHEYRHEHADFLTWGILKLGCRVDPEGDVHDLRVIENDANSVLAEFSLQAILDAELPPMPPEVVAELGIGGLDLKYDIIIY